MQPNSSSSRGQWAWHTGGYFVRALGAAHATLSPIYAALPCCIHAFLIAWLLCAPLCCPPAQPVHLRHTSSPHLRPGSVKKKQATPGPTFSSTQRADITAKVSPDVFSKHAGAGLLAKLPPG